MRSRQLSGELRRSGLLRGTSGCVPLEHRNMSLIGRPWMLVVGHLLTFAMAAVAPREVSAQTPTSAPPNAEMSFDIPAQPVASALDAYSAKTGIVAAYNGNLAVGRTSGGARGRLSPQSALRQLLSGSGLTAQFTTDGAFVVVPDTSPAAAVAPAYIAQAFLAAQPGPIQRYSGLIQKSLNEALCGSAWTRPGSYRLAVSFSIGQAGELRHVKLLDTTGDDRRDAAAADALRRARIGAPPPAGLPQPLTAVVLPQSSGGTVDCRSSDDGQRSE